jgi:hypothetical protein
LPLRLTTARDPRVRRIAAAVHALPTASLGETREGQLWDARNEGETVAAVLRDLNEAVADLFDLSAAERDLINDFWAGRGDTATAPNALPASSTGRAADLSTEVSSGISRYMWTFLEIWNAHLDEGGEFSWQIHRDEPSGILATVFETQMRDDGIENVDLHADEASWSAVMQRLGETLTRERAASLRSHGVIRVVTDSAIIIVKRDERRLWSATTGREDAEATTVQAMCLQPA